MLPEDLCKKDPCNFRTDIFMSKVGSPCHRTPSLRFGTEPLDHIGQAVHGPASLKVESLETNLASRWEGVRLPRASGKSPDFPGSSPNLRGSFSATAPEVLSLWNLTAIQRFPGSFPNFPGSSPNFPGSSRTSPEVTPFLWEA